MIKPGFLGFRRVKSGFLLIEVMVAISIGLIFVAALMRMQTTLLELREVFCVRGNALGLVLDFLENRDVRRSDQNVTVVKIEGREFVMSVKHTNAMVEWESMVGKKCCIEI